MKPKLLSLPHLLLATASLCGLMLLAAAAQPVKAAGDNAPPPANAAMIPAGDAVAAPPPFARRHGAMSMPYFSFARLLRSGG